MPNQEPKIVCPVCGAEFALSRHSNASAEVVIGNDSNREATSPTLTNTSTAEGKLAALRNAGVDVSNIFSITDAAGISKLARIENGEVQSISDDDPIIANIVEQGTIPNRRLFRRWIMSQVFHMLIHPNGFTHALQFKGYRYQWEMVIEEFRVQAKLSVNDHENFVERNRWFNRSTAISMAGDYLEILINHTQSLRVRKCRTRPYIRLKGRNVFLSEINEKVVAPLISKMGGIAAAQTPEELYLAVKAFYAIVKKTYIANDIRMSSVFLSAYKGAGAFFTMKNMILFHGCSIQSQSGKMLSRAGSMKKLYDKAEEHQSNGWRLFGMMKQFIEYNNICIKDKIAEWANAKH